MGFRGSKKNTPYAAQMAAHASAKILVITSAPLHDPVLEVDKDFDRLSIEISEQLWEAHKEIAERHGCLYLNAGSVARTADGDGEHLDEAGHAALAEAVAEILLQNTRKD